MNLNDYNHFIVAFSGGKDSLACLLHLIEIGVPQDKIELWHHDVDGQGMRFMDWPCTAAYCRAIAKALNIPIYFSWKVGGFLGEMSRNNEPTQPTTFEIPGAELVTSGGKGPNGTRLKFPQTSSNLNVRWCSAYLKIDVADKALRGQERFRDSKTLFITGERAQESKARSNYKQFEPHRSDARDGKLKRHIDHWRPVHGWSEEKVWQIIQEWSIIPHPAYRLGWGRVSCAGCIFGSKNQWASFRRVLPEQFEDVFYEETISGLTIQQGQSIFDLSELGSVYSAITQNLITEAKDESWDYPVFVPNWEMPAGAFGDSTGPT